MSNWKTLIFDSTWTQRWIMSPWLATKELGLHSLGQLCRS